MKVGFVLFEEFFQRRDIGSSRIRGHWIIEKMEEAEKFVQGKDYDVIIFQKAYWREMARAFKGIKILDICDPDWLDGAEVVSFISEMDGVITSTEKLAEDIRKFTDKPVICIPDRVRLEGLPIPKQHSGKAKKVVWFGYTHNATILDPTYQKIRKLDLTLKIIAENPIRIGDSKTEYVKWDKDTVDKEIQEADFVLLPEWKTGRGLYKSNNKTIHSFALGMPVAKTPQDMERFMDADERKKEAEIKHLEVVEFYNVEESVEELREFIKKLNEKKV